jgi:biopolymer transport protein ExbB
MFGKFLVRTLLAALVAIASTMLTASPAYAWWQKDWKYRKAVTVDLSPAGVNVSGPLGRTIVLVRLHSGNFGFSDALDNGADIRFVDSDDKTPLPYHIESYDAKTGLASVWVSLPTLSGGEKKSIWLYFGNKNAPVGEDVKGTFDPDYVAVYHFRENPGQPPADSTANANNAQTAPPQVDDSAIIARGAHFPGQGQLTIPETGSLAMPAGAPFTFSAWVKPEQLAPDSAIFARGTMIIGLEQGVPYVALGGASTKGTQPLKQGDWSHLAVVADGQTVKIYVNGVEAGAASAALPAVAGPIFLGGADGRPFTGSLDEVRLSKVARPAAMLMAEAQGEGPSGKLVAVSETAEKQQGGSSVLFFIVSKVETLDAVIIGLCLLLLAGAIFVMVNKNNYINRAAQGNKAFMRRFRQMHENLVSIATLHDMSKKERQAIGKSPLAHLFETGIEEIEVRRAARGSRPLTAEAIEAMRSAVDAVVVEENQKFDRAMVLLTIAISGGPFIGLLGTVIGVMSTFGGVAIAGDVNVNAIAPGIAAALLATIAGLAAAIPSLFGYNYLNSRISAMSDEMRVFVDRLVTRLAEMQAEAALGPPPTRLAAE